MKKAMAVVALLLLFAFVLAGQVVTGGGGVPGGTNGQVQFNNSGAFGGITGSSVSGANVTLPGNLQVAAGNASGFVMTQGAVFVAGQVVTFDALNRFSPPTNCSVNSVSPAACGSASIGSFVVPTTTTTYTVNTTAVKAASRIFLFPHTDTRDLPGAPTCVTPAITAEPTISAIVAATSFSIAIASTTGQTCWDYWTVN